MERLSCERCYYYVCPSDAPEGTEPDCTWTPSEDERYFPCSVVGEYMKKIERILSNRLEASSDDAKLKEDLRVWLQCEWQCSDFLDIFDYTILLTELDDLIAIARSKV